MESVRKLTPQLGLLLLVLFVILLHIPNLFEPYWYGDEGIYLTLGIAVRRGLTLYRDIHDNKPPLLYAVAALSHTQFWFKGILLIWHAITVVAVYQLSRLLFQKNRFIPLFVAAVFSVLVLFFEGNIGNGEIFMILPNIVGMILLWVVQSTANVAKRRGAALLFSAGLCFSIGFLFKVPAAFDFAAAISFAVVLSASSLSDLFRRFIQRGAFLFAGFIIPIGLTIGYYQSKGALEPYVQSALLANIGYLGSWSSGTHQAQTAITQSGLLIRTILLFASVGLLGILRSPLRLSRVFLFTVSWFLFALYGALLSERPYPHYLLQALVPTSLLLGILFVERSRSQLFIIGSIAAVTIAAYNKVGFWHYPIQSYYQNFWNWTIQRQSTPEYFSYFGEQVSRTYEIARYVMLTTNPKDRIFVWGDDPNIYALSNRLPPGRYTVAYHVADFNGWEETVDAIRRENTKVVIVLPEEARPFPQLVQELNASYIKTRSISGASIFRKFEF